MFNQAFHLFTGAAGAATPLTNEKSVVFDGVDEYIDFGDTHQYDVGDAFSISLWVKPTSAALSSQKQLFSKTTIDSNVFGYTLHIQNGNLRIQARAPSQLRIFKFSTLSLTADVWQLVTLTYSGANNLNGFRCYLNDTVGATPGNGTLTNSWLSGQSFFVGQRSNSFYYPGSIDEMGVWDKSLTASEVTSLYNGGTPVDLTTHTAASNLQSWIRFGDGDTFPTLTDNEGSADGTMTNMESGDIQSDVPS